VDSNTTTHTGNNWCLFSREKIELLLNIPLNVATLANSRENFASSKKKGKEKEGN